MPKGAVTFNMTGYKNMSLNLLKLYRAYPNLIDEAHRVEAEGILSLSNSSFVPIDEGDLMESGHVVQTPRTQHRVRDTHRTDIVYDEEYAQAVHEHPSRHSPASWRGKIIHWTKPGTGPKYLERAMRIRRVRMFTRMSQFLKASTERIARG